MTVTARALLAAALAATAASCGAQSPEQGVFVTTIGADTVLVERFSRTRDSLSGTIAARPPGGGNVQQMQYAALLAPQGLVTGIGVGASAAGAPPQVMRVSFGIDSAGTFALMHAAADAAPVRIRTAAGVIPVINISIALLEQVVRRARNIPGDTVTVPILTVDDAQTTGSVVAFVAPDSAEVATRTERLRLRIDAAGRILGAADAARGIRVERVAEAPTGWFEAAEPEQPTPR